MALNKISVFISSKYANDIIEYYAHLYFTLMFIYKNNGIIKQS
jgi:hypothetical protein